ncbi:hypothetical protein EJ04DRAFT_533285 [Polyplosphaeria fusca]|uniref:Uncharacterized protein n=1 Tax=Polyplosphaeria fusca TaxID=682080 RepID=A0A9P4R605_9PLEO|nr:hypothetical protein EJ04DRAFT_533285 [Polyplosphaeria fusca]
MPSTPAQIRSLYRRLLRELPSTPTAASLPTRTAKSSYHQKLSSPSPIQQHARLRASSQSSSGAQSRSQVQQAEQFLQYVQAQRMYVTLVERYNLGMGMSEEERVRLTARRVGMNLPIEFKD